MEFKKSVLVLAHSNYLVTDAGVEKILQGQQKLFLENQTNFQVVYPVRKFIRTFSGIHEVTTSRFGYIENGKEMPQLEYQDLMHMLCKQQFQAVIIHELVTFRKDRKLFGLFDQITCPIYYYVHDYAMVCYSHTLMRNNKEYCGSEPVSLKKCYNCRYFLQGKSNAVWQQKFVKRYKQITYLFPSKVVRDIWKKTFQADNQLVIVPNTKFGAKSADYADKPENQRLKIAFIGYGRVEKGWNTWKKLCEKYDGKYELYVLGDGECGGKVEKIPVSVAKDGPNAMIDTIRKHNIDIAFLWSTRPETYSYTFFESFVSGCFVITNNFSGNIFHMTKEHRCGAVFESEEQLFAFLDDYEQVEKSVKKMYTEKKEHPLELESNDTILALIEGEES